MLMKYRLFVLAILLSSLMGTISCMNENNKGSNTHIDEPTAKHQVKVYYFHGKQRCKTCLAIESLTKEVVEKEFAAQVKTGKVVYKEVDISTPEGEKIADNYEVSWSSLILENDSQRVNLTDMAFGYAKSAPETFKSKLKAEITKLLQ